MEPIPPHVLEALEAIVFGNRWRWVRLRLGPSRIVRLGHYGADLQGLSMPMRPWTVLILLLLIGGPVLLLLQMMASRSADPLFGLSDKEIKAAKAHALSLCILAGKATEAESSMGEVMARLGDMAAIDNDRMKPVVVAGTAIARKRGCVAK